MYETLARCFRVQHAVLQLDTDQHRLRVGRPVHQVRPPHLLLQGGSQIVIHRTEDVRAPPVRQHRPLFECHLDLELVPGLAKNPVFVLLPRKATNQVERVGDLARNRERESARNDVEVAAVEDLKRHRFEQHERQQDDEKAPAKQRPRKELLHGQAKRPHAASALRILACEIKAAADQDARGAVPGRHGVERPGHRRTPSGDAARSRDDCVAVKGHVLARLCHSPDRRGVRQERRQERGAVLGLLHADDEMDRLIGPACHVRRQRLGGSRVVAAIEP